MGRWSFRGGCGPRMGKVRANTVTGRRAGGGVGGSGWSRAAACERRDAGACFGGAGGGRPAGRRGGEGRAVDGARHSGGLGRKRAREKGTFLGAGGFDDGSGRDDLQMIVLKFLGLLAASQGRVGKLFKGRTADRCNKWVCSIV